jgi:hypothetical protein
MRVVGGYGGAEGVVVVNSCTSVMHRRFDLVRLPPPFLISLQLHPLRHPFAPYSVLHPILYVIPRVILVLHESSIDAPDMKLH